MTKTLDAAHVAATRLLRDAGMDTAALDARLLLCHATGLGHEDIIARSRETLSPAAAARLETFVARRLGGEPVSRIRGVREFYGREFLIDAETLDPRPDTETLIAVALDLVARREAERPLRLLDLGTGTGCILLTLLAELPQAEGIGTDISEGALACAAANARRLGVAARAGFVRADWLDGVAGPFDLIVANPPYIADAEIDGLAPEVAAHDPRAALDGGPDGLEAYRRIAAGALAALRPEGHLLVEIGAGQGRAVQGLFRAVGLELEADALRLDLGRRPRCVVAGRPLETGASRRSTVKIGLENHGVQARFGPAERRYAARADFGAAGCKATRADIS